MALTGLIWWVDRWRKSTAYTDLSLEAQAAYRNLLDEAWLRGGPIPNNERTLAKAAGGNPAEWRKVRKAVLAHFTLAPDGWRNETLDDVFTKVQQIREWRSVAGKRGAAVRWQTDGNPYDKGNGKSHSKGSNKTMGSGS